MIINVKGLLRIIEKVKSGISGTSKDDSMSYLFFSGTDIISYNDIISVQHPFKTDFSLFVNAKDLQKFLSKLKVDEIKMEEIEGKLSFSSKDTKVNMNTIEDSEMLTRINSISESLNGKKWKILPDNFSKCILLCSYTTSKQASTGTLTCVYVNDDCCISSDNSRVSHVSLSSKMDEMFINSSEIKDLVNTNPIKYISSNSWLHFKNKDECIFSLRKKEGNYPNFMDFFNMEGIDVKLPKKLIEGIDITSIFMDVLDPVMTVKISKGTIILSIKSENGTSHHRSKIDYIGSDISFNINPEFLKEMMVYSLSITIGDGKLKMCTEDGFQMLTALYS